MKARLGKQAKVRAGLALRAGSLRSPERQHGQHDRPYSFDLLAADRTVLE